MNASVDNARRAFALLTLLPIKSPPFDDERPPDVAGWFPLVGMLLGGAALSALAGLNLASILWGDGDFIQRGALVLGVCVVASWALLTRFLHWDGLADVADAYWGGADTQRRLEIMGDSSVGAFGVTAVVIVALAQVGSVATILAAGPAIGWTIMSVAVVGRLAATFACWLGESARPGGLGSKLLGRPRMGGLLATILTLLLALGAVVVLHEWLGLIWALVAIPVAGITPHLLAQRFGGVNGDVMGASVLLTETFMLVLAALLAVF